MKWQKIRCWLAIAISLALCAFVVAAWFAGGALVAPANRVVGAPPADLPFVATTLESDSRSAIATWYLPVDNAKASLVLVHPIRGNRRSMLSRARLFHDAGYSIVMIDLQAHGESRGEYITVGSLERHDVRAAVDFARNQNPDHRIGVVGRSLGGAASLLASPLDIDALVLESVYPTVAEAVHNRVSMQVGPLSAILTPALLWQLTPRLGITTNELRPIDHIASVNCPVLVAAGDLDRRTTLDETTRLFAAAIEPKELVIFSGAAHVDLLGYSPKQYTSAVLSFLHQHLISSPMKTLRYNPPCNRTHSRSQSYTGVRSAQQRGLPGWLSSGVDAFQETEVPQ